MAKLGRPKNPAPQPLKNNYFSPEVVIMLIMDYIRAKKSISSAELHHFMEHTALVRSKDARYHWIRKLVHCTPPLIIRKVHGISGRKYHSYLPNVEEAARYILNKAKEVRISVEHQEREYEERD